MSNLTDITEVTKISDLFTDAVINKDIEDALNMKMLTEIVPKGMLTCIHASGGQGKSTLVASQIKRVLDENEEAEVIFLDYDSAKIRNAEMITKLNNIGGSRFKCLTVDSLAKSESYKDKLMSMNIPEVVVVIDALQGMFNRYDKDINSSKDAGFVMDMLKGYQEAGATVLIIHHSNKPDKFGWSQFRGSAVIQDAVDNLYSLKQISRDNDVLRIEVDVTPKYSCPLAMDKVVLDIPRDLSYTVTDSKEVPNKLTIANVSEEQLDSTLDIVETNGRHFTMKEVENIVKVQLGVGTQKAKTILGALISKGSVVKIAKEGTKSYMYNAVKKSKGKVND